VSVRIDAVCLERDFFPKDQLWGGLLRSRAVGLAFLWAVDVAQTDAFRLSVVQDFEGVAIKDAYDLAGEVGS
jgi:hypothetical protein